MALKFPWIKPQSMACSSVVAQISTYSGNAEEGNSARELLYSTSKFFLCELFSCYMIVIIKCSNIVCTGYCLQCWFW